MADSARERLIHTAFYRFAEHGFQSVGLDQILSDVGVTKTTFYNHFESKDELVVEVLRRRDVWEMQTFAQMLQAAGGPTAQGQLRALFDVLERWFRDHTFRGCIFISAVAEYPWPSHPVHRIAIEHRQTLERSLYQLAEQAGAEAPADLAAQLTLLIEGAFVYRHFEDNLVGVTLARQLGQRLLKEQLPRASPSEDQVSAAASG